MRGINGYVMRDQVRNLVPSIMDCRIKKRDTDWDESLPLYAVAAVTLVYLCAMAFSG